MSRVGVVLACVAVAIGGFGAPSSASRERVALLLGDSLTSETRPVFVAPRGWRLEFLAFPGVAPCDWLHGRTNFYRLIARHPAAVLIETAANDYTSCLKVDGKLPVLGSAAFLHRYEQSLLTIARVAGRHGARVIYVDAPPFFTPSLQRASVALDRWARTRLPTTTLPRWAVSVDGHAALYMRCQRGETEADGCAFGMIPVRTLNESGHLHFCPYLVDFTKEYTCSTYSSGEHRWARAVMKVLRERG